MFEIFTCNPPSPHTPAYFDVDMHHNESPPKTKSPHQSINRHRVHNINKQNYQSWCRIYKIATKIVIVWRMRSRCTPMNPGLQSSNGAPQRTAQRKPHPSSPEGLKIGSGKPPPAAATKSATKSQKAQKPMVFLTTLDQKLVDSYKK